MCLREPKHCAYKTHRGKKCCKVWGITLNFRSSVQDNLESMVDMVHDPHKIVRDVSSRKSQTQDKTYKGVYNKRVVQPYSTLRVLIVLPYRFSSGTLYVFFRLRIAVGSFILVLQKQLDWSAQECKECISLLLEVFLALFVNFSSVNALELFLYMSVQRHDKDSPFWSAIFQEQCFIFV